MRTYTFRLFGFEIFSVEVQDWEAIEADMPAIAEGVRYADEGEHLVFSPE